MIFCHNVSNQIWIHIDDLFDLQIMNNYANYFSNENF